MDRPMALAVAVAVAVAVKLNGFKALPLTSPNLQWQKSVVWKAYCRKSQGVSNLTGEVDWLVYCRKTMMVLAFAISTREVRGQAYK
jgi:hypothetical protein